MAVNWDSIYQDELSKISDPTNDINARRDADIKAAADLEARQEEKLGATRDESKRQGYVNYMLDKKDMPMLLAANGINGGATETANMDMMRDYRNALNSADQNYANSADSLQSQLQADESSVRSQYQQELANALQNRITQATSNTNARAQIQEAEEQAEAAREQAAAAASTTSATGYVPSPGPSAPPEAPPDEQPTSNYNPYTTPGYAGTPDQNSQSISDASNGVTYSNGKTYIQEKVDTPYGTQYRTKERVETPYGTQYRYVT